MIEHENTYTLSELSSSTASVFTLKALEPKKITISVYIEAWDIDATSDLNSSSFNLGLIFGADYISV